MNIVFLPGVLLFGMERKVVTVLMSSDSDPKSLRRWATLLFVSASRISIQFNSLLSCIDIFSNKQGAGIMLAKLLLVKPINFYIFIFVVLHNCTDISGGGVGCGCCCLPFLR